MSKNMNSTPTDGREFESLSPEEKFGHLFDIAFDEADMNEQVQQTGLGGIYEHREIIGVQSGKIVDLTHTSGGDEPDVKEIMVSRNHEGAAVLAVLRNGVLVISVGEITKKLDNAGAETDDWAFQSTDNSVGKAMDRGHLTTDDAVIMLDNDVSAILKENADKK